MTVAACPQRIRTQHQAHLHKLKRKHGSTFLPPLKKTGDSEQRGNIVVNGYRRKRENIKKNAMKKKKNTKQFYRLHRASLKEETEKVSKG